ncbi:MAG TPA: DUF1178 family protein [Usitatibacter sp.]|jgi:hypothetical protein|nr:DUF1178 family protein [Usitatibacter sp.]
MIVYQLECTQGHCFEGWFASAQACDEQASDGRLQCPACSTSEVRKLPSAPHVHTGESAPSPEAGGIKARREAIAKLRNLILTSTEDVGRQFAEVARRIHYQEEASRDIRGQVTAEEAEELREEGVETLTLPPDFLPTGEVH